MQTSSALRTSPPSIATGRDFKHDGTPRTGTCLLKIAFANSSSTTISTYGPDALQSRLRAWDRLTHLGVRGAAMTCLRRRPYGDCGCRNIGRVGLSAFGGRLQPA